MDPEQQQQTQGHEAEDEALDARGRNLTLFLFGGVILLIVGLVFNNWRIKQERIAGMKSQDAALQARSARAMMEGFSNDGHIAEQLQGERPSVRAAAVRALLALAAAPGTDDATRKNAAKLTVPFLKDTDQPIKEQAIQALTAMGPEIAMEAATHALGDTDGAIKAGAQTVCQNFAPYSLPALLAFTPDKDKPGAKARLRTAHRTHAGNAMHEISKRKEEPWNSFMIFGPQALPAAQRTLTGEALYQAMRVYLKAEKPLVGDRGVPVLGLVAYLDPSRATEEDQNNVITILDRIADKRAVPHLIPRLQSPETRRATIGALGRLGDPMATPHLMALLPHDETNRLELVIAMGRIADARATDVLIQHGLGSVSAPVRAASADSLKSIGIQADPAVRSTVVAKLAAAARGTTASDPGYYRTEGAARALAGLKDPTATRLAIGLLGHPADNVRAAAAGSLGDSGDPSAVRPLIQSFADRNGTVAGLSARSLSAFGALAVEPLVAALADPRRVYWAALAIQYIGPPAVSALEKKVLAAGPGAGAAANLLGDLRHPGSAAVLRRALQSSQDPDFRFAVSSALQRLGGEASPAS